jgi:c-di-GMP-binding flagellar brake protein YcgR
MIWDGMEKRRFIRANIPLKIIIYSPHEHTITTQTENIGAGGLRVIINEKLDTASISSLEFSLNDKIITCKGRVVWVLQNPTVSTQTLDTYDTGFEFFDINQDDRESVSEFVDNIISKKK